MALAALASAQPACVAVLGLDDYGPFAEGMCKCDEALGFLDDCEETLTRRLEGASQETRQKWLERFHDKKCVECQHALECYYTSPTCVRDGKPCKEHDECCGFDDDGGWCSPEGQCVRPADGCVPIGGPCSEPTQCCGSEGGVADCGEVSGELICFNYCDPSDDIHCPNCCSTLEVPSISARTSLCYPGCEELGAELCDPEADPSTQCVGQSCCPQAVGAGIFIHVCTPTTCADQAPD